MNLLIGGNMIKRGRFLKISLALASALFLISSHAATPDIRRDATVEAIERVMPSVVNIRTQTLVESNDPLDVFIRNFFDPFHRPQQSQQSLGSGVIIDEEGYILTNLHVVRRANRVQIKLSEEAGGGEYEVERISGTTRSDVALLKIIPKTPGEKFTPVKFAADGDLLLGETIIALGNPFGLGGSVSRGLLSSKPRAVPKLDERLDYSNWLQTDAAINPGNSGGALINLRGELIGLNVAILAQAQGICFAIPVQQVSEALAEIFTPETRNRWFGARLEPGSSPLAVRFIEQGSPAEKAGLKAGDKILQVDGKIPKGFMEINQWLRDSSQTNYILAVQRQNERRTFNVQLMPFEQLLRQRLGVDAQELDEDLAQRFGLNAFPGLVIAGVDKGGPAEKFLNRNFVITHINGKPIPNLWQAATALGSVKKGDTVELRVLAPYRRGNYLVRYDQGVLSLKTR